MTAYNGHRSWNAWNVSLWINNDEGMYRRAVDLARRFGIVRAAKMLFEELEGQKTPDGARYTSSAVRSALREII